MRFKGPAFPSYFKPPNPDKKVKVWNPHQAVGQRMRVLKQKCRALLNSKDPEVVATGDRIISVVNTQALTQPDIHREYAILTFMSLGLDKVQAARVPWVAAMNAILDTAVSQQSKKITVRYIDEDPDGSGESPDARTPEDEIPPVEAQPDGQGPGETSSV